MKKNKFVTMGLVLCIILPLGGYSQEIQNQTTGHSYVTTMVEDVLSVYERFYQYPHSILSLEYGEAKHFTPVLLPGGAKRITLLYANPAKIYLNMKATVSKNILWHEVFHTYKPINSKLLPVPISFSDGYIIGTQGMNIRIKLHGGLITGYGEIEEASAEFMAFNASDGKYTISDPGYAAIGGLMIKICNHFGLSPAMILHYESSGDGFFQFLQAISGKSVVKLNNILFLMSRFSEVRDMKETPDQALMKIIKYGW